MGDGTHAGHQVRGRHRCAQQIAHAVGQLRRGDYLVLDCGTVDDCYAQVRLALQGVYDVEYRDGAPERHYRTRTLSPARATAIFAAWADAQPDWSAAFDWTCIGSMFTQAESEAWIAPPGLPAPNARPIPGARRNGREPLFHIALASNWAAAQDRGEYRFSTRNRTLGEVGFIHAYFADQVESIARAFFSAEDAPPIVLVVDESKLPSPVRIEKAADGNGYFPHIYGPLPTAAVSDVHELRREPDAGVHWHWPYSNWWRNQVPDRIPVARIAGNRTDLVGYYDAGIFLAGFSKTTYLHLFGKQGRHRGSWIASAEQALGEDASRAALMDYVRELVENLPGREFGDISIAPFAVQNDAGRRWGLFDETVEYGFPHAELRPNRLGFTPPWNGEYDT